MIIAQFFYTRTLNRPSPPPAARRGGKGGRRRSGREAAWCFPVLLFRPIERRTEFCKVPHLYFSFRTVTWSARFLSGNGQQQRTFRIFFFYIANWTIFNDCFFFTLGFFFGGEFFVSKKVHSILSRQKKLFSQLYFLSPLLFRLYCAGTCSARDESRPVCPAFFPDKFAPRSFISFFWGGLVFLLYEQWGKTGLELG